MRRRGIFWSVVATVTCAGLLAACSGSDGGAGGASRGIDGSEGAEGAEGSSGTHGSNGDAEPVARPAPTLRTSDCVDPSTPPATVRCETLVVPEDRSHPDERQLELPVLRVAASGTPSASAADAGPVVYLHGGPGAGAVEGWIAWTMLADGLGREVVTFDQRGGGAASPRLDCPEHDEAVLGALAAAAPWEQERAAVAEALVECRDRLRSEGVDLDHYDTPTSVEDLEDLRVALGVERMSLVGVSYGSRLALDYLRTHPERVSSLVLDGVDAPGSAGPEVERGLLDAAIDRLVASCAADAACAAAHPDLGGTIERVAATYDETPLAVTLAAPPDGSRTARPLLLTGADLLAGLFSGMYDTAQIPLLPSVVERLAAGDTALVEVVLRRAAPSLLGGATGVATSVNCADLAVDGGSLAEVSRSDPGASSTMVLTGTDSFCDVWNVEPVDEDFVGPIVATGGRRGSLEPDQVPPTLVVSGELDPVTPAAGARAMAEELGATYVEVPRGGHAPLLTDGCARRSMRSFLVDAAAPDLSCVGTTTPMPFT